MFNLLRHIWVWSNRHRIFAGIGAIGAFLSGLVAFFGWLTPHLHSLMTRIWPDPIAVVISAPPLAYDPWNVLAIEKISKQINLESLFARRDRFSASLIAPIDISASTTPAWKRTTIYDFAYAVDYVPGQGDGPGAPKRKTGKLKKPANEKIETFFVSCVGRMDRAICQTPSEYREANHIHYKDWLQMPVSLK